jgi:hypothetical protein
MDSTMKNESDTGGSWALRARVRVGCSADENIDPVHDRKRLSAWFAEFSQTPAYVTPATKAIQAIGSNAVPYLVRFLAKDETSSWTKRAAMISCNVAEETLRDMFHRASLEGEERVLSADLSGG